MKHRLVVFGRYYIHVYMYGKENLLFLQLINHLTTKELILALPKVPFRPRTYILKPGQCLFLGGLARLDYEEVSILLSCHIILVFLSAFCALLLGSCVCLLYFLRLVLLEYSCN